MFIDIS